MSNKNLTKENDLHFEGSPKDHVITMETKCFEVIKPSITLESDSGLKEELISEVDVPSTERSQYFSTPVQRHCKSSTIDQQENSLGYKSFFNLECEEIIHQLQSKAVQGWSATKRKLEELDISTIEAEPLPLLCCTPKAVLDETTCSAKRRRIDYQGEGHFSLNSFLTKDSSPVLRICRVQPLNQSRALVQEKSSPQLKSQSHLKCSLSLNTSRTADPQGNLPANREKNAPEELETEVCSPLCYSKMNFRSHECTTSTLEFRSFFAAECEKICNHLKRHNTEMFVSFIEAEPPPVLSATMNSTIILELGSKETSARGVSQLDLEKMNMDYSTERSFFLQKATDTGLCNGIVTVSKDKMITDTAQDSAKIDRVQSIANATHDINNEECADGTIQGVKIEHWQLSIADIRQDIGTIHDQVTEVDATQGMLMMCKKESTADLTQIIKTDGNFSSADTPEANIRMSEVESQTGIMQNTVKVHVTVPVANATHDISICDDASIENDAQGIVEVGDWSSKNGTQDNMTCRKMPFPNDPSGTGSSDASLANDTHDVGVLCNKAPAVDSMHSNRKVCAADGTQEMVTTAKLSAVNVTVDIGTTWGTGTDQVKNTNSLQACSKISTPRNIVAVALPVQNVLVNNFQNIVPVDGAMNKTITRCSLTRPNLTHNIISLNRGTVKYTPRDLTQLTSYEDASYIPVNVSIIDEKPQINSTQTLMSICNEVIANDSLQGRGDLTKVIATNCTQLQVCYQPEKQSRHMWPIAPLACPSPSRGRMCNMKDSTYNLDLTDIAPDENFFYNRPMSFITSTPLPSVSNHLFIKKPCGLPVKSKPSMYSGQKQDNTNKVMSTQRTPKPQLSVTGQSLGGDLRTRVISKGLQYPSISKSATPKVMESKIPQPSPCSTLALSLLKTPQTAKAVVSSKNQMTLRRTTMKPPLAPSSLSRKNMPYHQPCKSASSTLQQQTPVSWTGKHSFKKRTDIPKLPASSLGRPSFEFSTPGCQKFAGKIQNIPGPQSAARICKGPSVLPSSVFAEFDPSRNAPQEHTFIRPTNPVGSQISSKIKPRVSGLPVRK